LRIRYGSFHVKKEGINQHPFVLLLIIFCIPLLVGGVSGKLLDGSMRVINVRTENATVHIKDPYNKYVKQLGVLSEKSSFGNNFIKLKNITILLNGVGKHYVLRVRTKKNQSVKLVIPQEYINVGVR